MNDTIEAAAQATSELTTHEVPRKAAYAVAGFALYGVASATRDATKLVKRVIENRKAKKAAEVVETDDTPQQ